MQQENSEIPGYIQYTLSRDKNNFNKESNLAFIYNIEEIDF